MKKLLAIALLCLGVAGYAKADEGSACVLHGFYLEPTVEAFIPFNDDLDSTVYAGGKGGYQFNEWFAAEIEAGWANPDLADVGDVSTVPLLFNARINLWPGVYCVDPYVFGGIGIAFNELDGVPAGVEIDDSFAGQIGAGIEYHINESLSAQLELDFYFNSPDLNVPLLDEEDVELNAFRIGGGITWRF